MQSYIPYKITSNPRHTFNDNHVSYKLIIFERMKWCKNAENLHEVSVRCASTSHIYAYGGPCGAARFALVVVYLRLWLWNWSEGRPLISVRLATFTKAYNYLHDMVCEVKRVLLFFKERMGGWILSSQSWLFFCQEKNGGVDIVTDRAKVDYFFVRINVDIFFVRVRAMCMYTYYIGVYLTKKESPMKLPYPKCATTEESRDICRVSGLKCGRKGMLTNFAAILELTQEIGITCVAQISPQLFDVPAQSVTGLTASAGSCQCWQGLSVPTSVIPVSLGVEI